MNIDNLKTNDRIYDVDAYRIKCYKYCCVHPSNPNYHILLDENEDPFKIYNEKLQFILNKSLNYDSAKILLIELLQNKINRIKEFV